MHIGVWDGDAAETMNVQLLGQQLVSSVEDCRNQDGSEEQCRFHDAGLGICSLDGPLNHSEPHTKHAPAQDEERRA